MKRKYSNNPDVFFYICGSFTPTAQRQSINDADCKIKIRDQDKAWVPHKVCANCVETLRSWSHGKDKHFLFGIPMIWREQIDHVADCYFCMVIVKGFNKKNEHSTPISKLQFSFERPVPHVADASKSVFNYLPYLEDDTLDILQLQQMMTCLSIVLAKVVGYCLMPPAYLTRLKQMT